MPDGSERETRHREQAYGEYVPLMNAAVSSIFRTALRLSIRDPGMLRTLLHLGRVSRAAAGRRKRLAGEGLVVPPVLILSVTSRCNLRCKGCYASAHSWGKRPEMDLASMDAIMGEAGELGVMFCILAGGEPLVRTGLLEVTARHPDVIFPLFTNGVLITEEVLRELRPQRHVVPILSVEGDREHTDRRRGEGVHEAVQASMGALVRAGIPFGASITVSTANLDAICSAQSLERLYRSGARIFYFIEYVAMHEGTDSLELSQKGRSRLLSFIEGAKSRWPGIYVAFPGNEERYGGCLSSGRGFVHINPAGGLEPCPAAPFTDVNVCASSLREALRSPLLAVIRDNHELLDESKGGCVLWHNRHLVEELLDKTTPHERTGDI